MSIGKRRMRMKMMMKKIKRIWTNVGYEDKGKNKDKDNRKDEVKNEEESESGLTQQLNFFCILMRTRMRISVNKDEVKSRVSFLHVP